MFERFTDRARRVVVLAQQEARELDHNYIGTEHILLGLIREGEGVAAKALESLEISLETVRQQVEEMIGRGEDAPSGHIPFTPRAKKVLELSLRESQHLRHHYIGTEHILLGLISEGEGVAAQVLVRLGADLDRVREQVLQLLAGHASEAGAEGGAGRTREASSGLTGLEPEVRIVGSPAQLAEMISRLRSIDDRLAAVERHLGLAPRRPGAPEEPARELPGDAPLPGPPGEPGSAGESGPQAG